MEHVYGWCFRGIYKGGLWEDDLHVSARVIETTDTYTVYCGRLAQMYKGRDT